MTSFRVEKDTMGEVQVPADALYGAQTQRAVENFPISGRPLPPEFIHALGSLKRAAAEVNQELGLLDPKPAGAIAKAAGEVAAGTWDAEFPIDVFQTGSGTSTNMNANEVIARRAAQILGTPVHPNDHVNFGQSSNDVIPSVLHVSAAIAIASRLIPALERLQAVLAEKARAFDGVIKTGRTHMMDATPIRLGQEFGGYASMVEHGIARLKAALPDLCELAVGGTAVGTGLNTHPEFGRRVAAKLAKESGLPFVEAKNHFEAQGSQDAALAASGAVLTVASSLMKIAADIRLMNSGPRCGLAEVTLPAVQPGSSIMPGKVNPVICEALLQVGAQVTGNHAAVTLGVQGGQLDLNTMLPLIADNLLESVRLLANAARVFADKAIAGLVANEETCRGYVEISPSMATALNPLIGYDKAAEIAKRSFKERRPVRELAGEMTKLTPKQIDEALDPRRQTEPGGHETDRGARAGGSGGG
ncbi:MAG: class II fumarate hydratase [Candidatus Eisenbacteria bacterium]|uniref:Fumarate hydratase class II n=1 Tax=Eiseniibacteriota bacterium TaxID=2212470 RepID=A0A9D6L9W4_UNCEI|nr:class II fumarate hydratase [Candidatus Eisenbacteria bacterium]MBI3538694.1 class II fumarate hydratase [Candidatus Eisenbacteria bacterium]